MSASAPPASDPWRSAPEVARSLGLSADDVRWMCSTGQVPTATLGADGDEWFIRASVERRLIVAAAEVRAEWAAAGRRAPARFDPLGAIGDAIDAAWDWFL